MSKEVQQFTELIRNEYALIIYGEVERQIILLNIAEAEMNGEITKEIADELRAQYNVQHP